MANEPVDRDHLKSYPNSFLTVYCASLMAQEPPVVRFVNLLVTAVSPPRMLVVTTNLPTSST